MARTSKPPSRTPSGPIAAAIAASVVALLAYGWLMTTHNSVRGNADAGISPAHTPPPPRTPPPPHTPAPAPGDPDVFLSPTLRVIPGAHPVRLLGYENRAAQHVEVSGSWSAWTTKHEMTRRAGGRWALDIGTLQLTPGRYEFKFRPDGEWESGANRVCYIDDDGRLQRPPDAIADARLVAANRIDVIFKDPVKTPNALVVRLEPTIPIGEQRWSEGRGTPRLAGHAVNDGRVTFLFDERLYGLALEPSEAVYVAGTFNGWNPHNANWVLTDRNNDGLWEGSFPLEDVSRGNGPAGIQFKFVVNGERWMHVPADAPNPVTLDGHTNLRLTPTNALAPVLHLTTTQPLALSQAYDVLVENLLPVPVRHHVSPGAYLDTIVSRKPLGAILDKAANRTIYRLFAPRAARVTLRFPTDATPLTPGPPPPNEEQVPMRRDPSDGVWETVREGLDVGRYYCFTVDGPRGDGDAFDPNTPIGDPYARAAVDERGPSIVLDPDATNAWFAGWTDQAYTAPRHEDVLIYEAHVRDLTHDPSSGVPPPLRGTFPGLAATQGRGTGIDRLHDLGVNMLELLPVAEFDNDRNQYGWGYNTAYYFAPESSYGTTPVSGSQYYEFKALVNELHRQGIGVILDVVYNHVGAPNVFQLIDRTYYFRQDPEHTLSNYSGCGNDLRTEAPMMRRLIVDNVLYWMREFHVDGFRFDLGELIDLETLRTVAREARRANPDVLLISEPWSFRGDHKFALKGTPWACWNDEFRESVKAFARGLHPHTPLRNVVSGSVASWAATPLQSVNYVESHDDRCLADDLSARDDHDARHITAADAARNRLAATLLFTSAGMPMIAEGQAFLRSKHGIRNTYNAGDAVNAIRWNDGARPEAAETLRYYRNLADLRASHAGRIFRPAQAPPDDYYAWIEPANPRAFGYVVNAADTADAAAALVLLNAAEQPFRFDVPLPASQWHLALDSNRKNARPPSPQDDIHAAEPATHRIALPPLTARVYLRKNTRAATP